MPTREIHERYLALYRAGIRAIAALCLCVLSGCPPTSVYRTADPVAKGAWQVGVGADIGRLSDVEQDLISPSGSLELSLRRGLADNFDMGMKLYTFGLEVNATWRLRKRRWSWALAPYAASLRTGRRAGATRASHVFAGSALIVSRPLSERWAFATGPFIGYGWYRPETGGSAHGAWLGGFVHLDRRVGARSHFTPELGVYRVVIGDVPVRGGAVRLGAAWRWDL